MEKNYHHKTNVIPAKPPPKNQITVPASGAAEIVYATGKIMSMSFRFIIGGVRA